MIKEPRGRAKTISSIISAAEQQFSETGLKGASILDIAKAAGVNKSLVYYYFSGIEDLFTEVVTKIHKSEIEALRSIMLDGMSSREIIEAIFHAIFDVYRKNRAHAVIMFEESFHSARHIRLDRQTKSLRDAFYVRLDNALHADQDFNPLQRGPDMPPLSGSSIHFTALLLILGGLVLNPLFSEYQSASSPSEECENLRNHLAHLYLRSLS